MTTLYPQDPPLGARPLVKRRGECAEGPRVFTELGQLRNAGKPECVKLPGRRPERPETTAKMTSQRSQCAGLRERWRGCALPLRRAGLRALWLARFRESKIARPVGGEARMAEIFPMLTVGLEVSCPSGLAASAWWPGLGDGSPQLWCDAGTISPGSYKGSESPTPAAIRCSGGKLKPGHSLRRARSRTVLWCEAQRAECSGPGIGFLKMEARALHLEFQALLQGQVDKNLPIPIKGDATKTHPFLPGAGSGPGLTEIGRFP